MYGTGLQQISIEIDHLNIKSLWLGLALGKHWITRTADLKPVRILNDLLTGFIWVIHIDKLSGAAYGS